MPKMSGFSLNLTILFNWIARQSIATYRAEPSISRARRVSLRASRQGMLRKYLAVPNIVPSTPAAPFRQNLFIENILAIAIIRWQKASLRYAFCASICRSRGLCGKVSRRGELFGVQMRARRGTRGKAKGVYSDVNDRGLPQRDKALRRIGAPIIHPQAGLPCAAGPKSRTPALSRKE